MCEKEQNKEILSDEQEKSDKIIVSEEEPIANEEEVIQEIDPEERKQKLKKNYLKIFIQLVLASIVYFISSACNKFEGLDTSVDVKGFLVLDYAKYIMYFAYALTIVAIVIFIIKLCKKENDIIIEKEKKYGLLIEKLYVVLDWIVLIPVCIALATFCFSFIFTFTNVQGDSMNPNISENDRLLVTYTSKYERFDVVVIKVNESYLNVSDTDLYLKRIIGLPGEHIDYRFENGITQLYVNGQKVSEDFYTEEELEKFLTYNSAGTITKFDWAEKCFTGGGTSPVKECDKVGGYYVIPEGYYFVLGDNRLVSKDSRNIGLVKEEDIIGITNYIVNNIFKPVKID